MSRQLVFDLPVREARGREDFFVTGANAMALAMLDDWPRWPLGKCLLTGAPGSGKTHLAHVWAGQAGARIVAAAGLDTADIPALAAGAVVVEDADRIAASRGAQEALLHLHNLMAEGGQPLLVTAARPPRDWGVALPDLISRMQAAPLARLELPDDALLRAVLAKQFTDRQKLVPPEILDWIVARMDRSLASARAAVADLDARALRERRAIDRRMVQDWLDRG